LQSKINKFRQETRNSEQDELARLYLRLLARVMKVYEWLDDVGQAAPENLVDLIYDHRDDEYFRKFLKDVIENEGEECVNDIECFGNIANEYELDSMNAFDEIFVYICDSLDLLSIEERLDLLVEYFSDCL
jgi:hypothetical protein